MKKQNFNLLLVNTHAHAAMMPMRGMAEDLPLDDWLKKHIWPYEALHVKAKFVYKHSKDAIKEMKANGIRAFCDMYFFEDEVAKAAIEEKMIVVLGETLLDFPTPSFKTPELALAETERLFIKYKNNPYVKVSVAPHSIYTVSKEMLLKAKKLAKKYNLIFQIHLAETKEEFDNARKKWKKTPTEYLDSLNILDENTLLHHCVWLTDSDINLIANRKSHIAHCPLSNLKLGSGIAPVAKMLAAGINVTLATDGAASSNRLDIWEAGKIASLIQKGVNHDPTLLPSKEMVRIMTVNGMKALKIEKFKNKSADEFSKYIFQKKHFNYLHHHLVQDLDFVL